MLHSAFNTVGPDNRSNERYDLPRTDLQIVPTESPADIARRERDKMVIIRDILGHLEKGGTYDRPKPAPTIYH